MCTVMISFGELPKDFNIENHFQIHDKNKDGYVNVDELTEMMRTFFGKHDTVRIEGIAKGDTKEDFDTKIIWSGASIVEFVGATTSRWLYGYKHI